MQVEEIEHVTLIYIIVYLGYTYYYNAYFGQGFGPILLDDLLCRGTEAKLIDCPRSTSQGIGTYDYCRGHLDDAGLRCQESKYCCIACLLNSTYSVGARSTN